MFIRRPDDAGHPNGKKAEVRERYAAGETTREELLEEAALPRARHLHLHGAANSSQVLLEAMGVQLPGSFVNPGTGLREALTLAATERALAITALGEDYRPLGRLVDERAIVNAIVALMATGGSTNHTIHWIAVARAAGIVLTWDDMDRLSQVVPLLTRVYPNGEADVNRFQAAGGIGFVFRELLDAGLMHDDIETILPGGIREWTREPTPAERRLVSRRRRPPAATTRWCAPRPRSKPRAGCARCAATWTRADQAVGGRSNTARSEAPAVVVDDPRAAQPPARAGTAAAGFRRRGPLPGPRANGMPELHSAGPAAGHAAEPGPARGAGDRRPPVGRVGKIPAAIHLTPEGARRTDRQAARGRHRA